MLMGDNRLPMIVLPQAQTICMTNIIFRIAPFKVVGMVVRLGTIDMIDSILVLKSLAERKRNKTVDRDIVCVFCTNLFKANTNVSIVPDNSFTDDAAMRANPSKTANFSAVFKTGYREPIFVHGVAPSAAICADKDAS